VTKSDAFSKTDRSSSVLSVAPATSVVPAWSASICSGVSPVTGASVAEVSGTVVVVPVAASSVGAAVAKGAPAHTKRATRQKKVLKAVLRFVVIRFDPCTVGPGPCERFESW
jgi:hypothetical protein